MSSSVTKRHPSSSSSSFSSASLWVYDNRKREGDKSFIEGFEREKAEFPAGHGVTCGKAKKKQVPKTKHLAKKWSKGSSEGSCRMSALLDRKIQRPQKTDTKQGYLNKTKQRSIHKKFHFLFPFQPNESCFANLLKH